ncbi:MAG: PucR family transcriptional regulator [Erysipelothrix sp.]|nr:PucR family transcriptional regulator [Erysipelothrix sp.]
MIDQSLIGKAFIFVYFKSTNQVDKILFIDTLSSFLQTQEGFFIDENSGVFLIEEYDEIIASNLIEINETISFDFSTKIQFLITPRQTIDKNFDQIIKKQNELFTKTNNIETIMYLPDLIIEQNLPKISNPLFTNIYDYIKEDADVSKMIIKLWESNANISQTSNELYIHRNTLIYRINKFQTDTNLDLKKPQDLLIAYLIANEVKHENNHD